MTDTELAKYHKAHQAHRLSSTKRTDADGNPILFKLTLEEWVKIWLDSGHFDQRGCGKGKYVMSRVNDLGHYEVGNVFIQLHTDNAREAQVGKKHPWVSANMKGKPKEQVTCPHCGLTSGKPTMVRHHFDNCKIKPR